MGMKVLITEEIAQEGKDYLVDNGYEIKMGNGVSQEQIIEDVKECQAILVRTALINKNVLEAGNKLKVVAKHGVGVDNIDVDIATKLGIQITNAPESNANSVAEHTMGLILATSKNFLVSYQEMVNGNFNVRDEVKGVDLEGKILGLVGVGKIGSLVAKKAYHGFGMRVIGYDPYIKPDQLIDEIQLVDKWEDVFKKSDFVSLHLPANDKTRGIIGKKEFDLMKSTGYLINAARGLIVDECELIKALKSNTIKGAGLDVLEKEPPQKDNELFNLSNVFLSPHNAALTIESGIRMATHAAKGIHEVLSGNKPSWPVNNI